MGDEQFAVLRRGLVDKTMFEGSRDKAYEWLLEHNELDAPGYDVLDTSTGQVYEDGEFIRKFEEELEPEEEHKCLSEERVRVIVREELKKVFNFMVETSEESVDGAILGSVEQLSFESIMSLCGVVRDEYLGNEDS